MVGCGASVHESGNVEESGAEDHSWVWGDSVDRGSAVGWNAGVAASRHPTPPVTFTSNQCVLSPFSLRPNLRICKELFDYFHRIFIGDLNRILDIFIWFILVPEEEE